MRGGWSRFWLYMAVVAALVVVVVLATSGVQRSAGEVIAQVVFIGGMAYLITFVVWPRRTVSPAHPAVRAKDMKKQRKAEAKKPQPDARPVVVIGSRPAGSKPGAHVHARETPTARSSRGRRPSPRQATGEMRWPTR